MFSQSLSPLSISTSSILIYFLRKCSLFLSLILLNLNLNLNINVTFFTDRCRRDFQFSFSSGLIELPGASHTADISVLLDTLLCLLTFLSWLSCHIYPIFIEQLLCPRHMGFPHGLPGQVVKTGPGEVECGSGLKGEIPTFCGNERDPDWFGGL